MMLHNEKPVSPVPVSALPMKPPTSAPTIPMIAVTMTPPGSLPGMIAFAIAPAIKPSTIHATIPIRSPPVMGGSLHPSVTQRTYHARLEAAAADEPIGRVDYVSRYARRRGIREAVGGPFGATADRVCEAVFVAGFRRAGMPHDRRAHAIGRPAHDGAGHRRRAAKPRDVAGVAIGAAVRRIAGDRFRLPIRRNDPHGAARS